MIVIRDGRPQERAALDELQRRASLMWEEYRAYLLANPDVIVLPLSLKLAESRDAGGAQLDQERPVGFARTAAQKIICDLDGLFVEPGFWGRGIARTLVEDAAARARAAGAAAIEVLANPRAEGFYAKLGFAVCGGGQTLFGPANRMRLLTFQPQS